MRAVGARLLGHRKADGGSKLGVAGRATSSEIILIESSTLLSHLSSRMLSRVVLALLLIDPAASLVLPVSSPVSHGVRRAPAPVAFDLKKM